MKTRRKRRGAGVVPESVPQKYSQGCMELARPEKFGAAPTVLADKTLSPRRLPGQPQWIPLESSPPAGPGLGSPQPLFGQRVLEQETDVALGPCFFLPSLFSNLRPGPFGLRRPIRAINGRITAMKPDAAQALHASMEVSWADEN